VPPTLSPRAVRGLAVIAVSLVGLAAVIALHVRPASRPSPHPAAAPQPDITSTMDWISAREGWISAFDRQAGTSTLFHTTDAGRHWSRQRVARGVEAPEFFDPLHGVLASGAGTFRTSDGGRRWQPLTLPAGARGQHPAFADARHGWVWDPSQDDLQATADGGTQWRRLPAAGLPAAPAPAQLLGFRDTVHGWLAVAGVLYGTADGGRTWAALALPAPADGQLDLGPLCVAPDGRGQLLVSGQGSWWVAATADGGATWQTSHPLPPLASNLAASCVDGAVSWAWSATQLQLTHDAGGHWTPVALPAWNLLRLQALGATTVWVAATVIDALQEPRWTLFSSTDSGLTWTPAITPSLS
jgi:photosystem II stability/assembly factor-like uncharacterized protein